MDSTTNFKVIENGVIKTLKQTSIGSFIPKFSRQTYPQNWPAYNQAQTREKLHFMDFADDLINVIEEPEQNPRGRPKKSFREMLFSLILNTYSGKSARRANSELEIAKDMSYISSTPYFNTILNYYNNEAITPTLQKLLILSSIPLRLVEQDFAIDSSGFSTSVYSRWFDHKWKHKKESYRQWVKAHVMSGVKTNVITALEVTQSNVADTTQFRNLLLRTHQNFPIREVLADMAYSSRDNLQFVTDCGGVPYIPFKKNARERSEGHLIWGRTYRHFIKHKEEFMQHYHQRSNAESVFSMIKRKFNSHLKTKSFVGQTNEILCIALCHNICVLIQEMFELGIDVNFCATANFAQLS